MDLFLYVVIVIVVILKIIFWVFYFYSRYKRKEIQRLLTQVSAGTDLHRGRYEEQLAVPQPAFIFSQQGQTHQYPAALPAYAEEDPGKIDIPPPPYIINGEAQPVLWREAVEENADSQPLINSDPPSPT